MTDPKEKKVPIRTRKPGRLGGGMFDRVKLPQERHPIEEILYGGGGTTGQAGSTEVIGTTTPGGSTDISGSTGVIGTTDSDGSTVQTGTTGQRGSTTESGTTKQLGTTARTDSTDRMTSAKRTAIAPERDFHKVPNSITRQALAAGLFKGKSKAVWDYLWRESRGAIVPTRTVRRSRPQLKAGAGFGSMGTVDSAVRHLQAVGLISVTKIVGEADGNEYEIFTPEEVTAKAFSLPSPSGTTTQIGTTETTQNPVLPVVPESGSTGTTLSPTDAESSGDPKTSFKTIETKTDDEAFAGLVALLKEAAEDVTGKGTTSADRERWCEVAELLVTELKVAAARTTVSSAPAFLAEHLRRRLRKADARQIEREVAEATAGASATSPPRPELSHEQVQEQANLMSSLLADGATIEELEGQFASNFRPAQWHQIRSIALAQHTFSKSQPTPAPADDVLES